MELSYYSWNCRLSLREIASKPVIHLGPALRCISNPEVVSWCMEDRNGCPEIVSNDDPYQLRVFHYDAENTMRNVQKPTQWGSQEMYSNSGTLKSATPICQQHFVHTDNDLFHAEGMIPWSVRNRNSGPQSKACWFLKTWDHRTGSYCTAESEEINGIKEYVSLFFSMSNVNYRETLEL